MISLATVRIIGPSMEPSMRNGDVHVVVLRSKVKAGDAVLLSHPGRPDFLTVKRIVRRDSAGWWVEGDNRGESTDSRHFGAVPETLIRGRVIFRLRPLRR